MEQACRRHSIRILLMAHHADDQAELFMMRMARGSGIIGLAGMAFISSIFPQKPLLDGTCDLLLIRPLLVLTKHDLYRVCEKAGQEWIEDPTNRKQIFARNCIRQALEEPPFDELRVQIQHLIAACRKTRALLDKERDKLLQDIVSVSQDFAFATINLGRMSSSHASDAVLGRVLVAVLQASALESQPT
jgi:tRNA(Ile)-lysidine synthase TilS/MesJ